jgi:tetratricopeptide (TPR) repeat protein
VIRPSRLALAAAVVGVLGLVAVRELSSLALAWRRVAAERLYDAGDYHEAYDAFRTLALAMTRRRPAEVPPVEYNSGNAAYRLGRFQDAVRHFRGGLAGAPALQERSDYNLGNSYMWLSRGETDRRGSLHAAISAYEDALLLDPRDADAKWNLEVALERLDIEQQRLSGGLHSTANWGGGNLTKSGYEGAPQSGAGAAPGGGFGAGGGEDPSRELSETDARRLLNAVERAQVTGQDVRPIARAKGPARKRDW